MGVKKNLVYPENQKSSALNKLAKYVGIGILLSGLGLGVTCSLSYLRRGNALLSLTSKNITTEKSIDDLLNSTFICPVDIAIRKEDNHPVAYVLDAGDGSVHRFGEKHSIGRYSPSGQLENKCAEYLRRFSWDNKMKGLIPFKVRAQFGMRGYELFESALRVDYLDGTVLRYEIPSLKFIERVRDEEEKEDKCFPVDPGTRSEAFGSNLHDLKCTLSPASSTEIAVHCENSQGTIVFNDNLSEKEFNRWHFYEDFFRWQQSEKYSDWEKRRDHREMYHHASPESFTQMLQCKMTKKKPTYFTLLNDSFSKITADFSALLPLSDGSNFEAPGEVQGRCNLFPILAFYKSTGTSQKAFFGYGCDNGELERYEKIENVGEEKPIAAASYHDTIFLLQEGIPHVKIIKLKTISAGGEEHHDTPK